MDCGTERDLRDVVIVIKGDLARSPLGVAYTYQLLHSTRWNLCMADPARRAAQLDDVCWYKEDEPVSALPKVRDCPALECLLGVCSRVAAAAREVRGSPTQSGCLRFK